MRKALIVLLAIIAVMSAALIGQMRTISSLRENQRIAGALLESSAQQIKYLSVDKTALETKVNEQYVLINFTALKCRKYANIVRRDPSRAIFLPGWIDRSFEWTKENL